MEMREVVEIETDNYLEEQYILEKFPEAVFISLAPGATRFYLLANRKTEVESAIMEWKEREGE